MEQSRTTPYEPMLTTEGSTNPKYVDLLEEDKAIAGQKFACISFVSPENILKNKELFIFQEFLKGWELSKSIEKFQKFTGFLSYKYNLNGHNVMTDLEEFIKSEKSSLFDTTLEDEYKTFIDKNESRLNDSFNDTHNFQTSTRGIKVRGVYPTQKEAELRCKMLREIDPNHDVYVGPVGLWMPWEPEAYKTGRVEYLENELNQLMHEKQTNEDEAKMEFDKRLRDTKMKAIEENKKLASQTGNKLSQNVDSNGNLIGVNLDGSNDDISVADIRKELFENENVVVGKHDYGLSELEKSGTITIDRVNNTITDNLNGLAAQTATDTAHNVTSITIGDTEPVILKTAEQLSEDVTHNVTSITIGDTEPVILKTAEQLSEDVTHNVTSITIGDTEPVILKTAEQLSESTTQTVGTSESITFTTGVSSEK